MPTTFLSLPGEVRNIIYRLALVKASPLRHYLPQELGTGLFLTNKEISQESLTLFYTENCFNFNRIPLELVALFLSMIGARSASLIQSMYLDAPSFKVKKKTPEITLKNDGSLWEIVRKCSGLQKLMLSEYSMCQIEEKLLRPKNEPKAAEILDVYDRELRKFSALREIHVDLERENGECEGIRQEMTSRGWTTSWESKADERDDPYGDKVGEYVADVFESLGLDSQGHFHYEDEDGEDVQGDVDSDDIDSDLEYWF